MTKIGFIVACVLGILNYLGYVALGWFEILSPIGAGFLLDILLIILGVVVFGNEFKEAFRKAVNKKYGK